MLKKPVEKYQNLIRTLLFMTVFVLVFLIIQPVFKNKDTRFFQSVTVLREERPDSVDAVYIGASNVHCFWIPVSAWQNHGISVLSLTSNAMPIAAWIYMIEEVRKTQPDALIILNLNPFKEDTGPDQVKLHRIADYMPLSANKLRMIRDLSDEMGISISERLEFYLPFVRFHSKWATLASSDFTLSPDGIKNGLIYYPHWNYSQNLTNIYTRYPKEKELSQQQGRDLAKLIDYLDRKQPNVLFITVPQAIEDKTMIGQMNKVESILKEHGYPCLNLLNEPEKTDVLLDRDFYDKDHTNVHGALKFTEFLSQYLIEKYGFRDKRGEQIEAGIKDGKITFSWTSTEGAEAYQVWRKKEDKQDGSWVLLEQVDKDILSVTDGDIQSGKEYTYTVVPLRTEDGAEIFGNFSYKGITVKAE